MKTGFFINRYEPCLKSAAPETSQILEASNLYVHPAVTHIVLEGSRGPVGGFRPDSDIDLALVVNTTDLEPAGIGSLLREVLVDTLERSSCPVELDIAAVYDARRCGLVCLNASGYEDVECRLEQTGCLGVYKIQKGFDGFVPPIVEIKKIFPFLTIWKR